MTTSQLKTLGHTGIIILLITLTLIAAASVSIGDIWSAEIFMITMLILDFWYFTKYKEKVRKILMAVDKVFG
ncbi:MAG: hypothetical protein MRY57_01435 [Candidatus Pacebacteria bacterium]|nr:hypothetical protein [Candidatus Paceibacterota bacterium]